MPGKSRIRAMTPGDIPQVASLFFTVFREGRPVATDDFNAYFHDLFFSSPSYDPQYGSVVSEGADGRIENVVTAVPMRYLVQGRPIMARLVCTFMAAPDANPRGAAELVLTLRPRNQDLCFTDSASQVTADHFRATGGALMPVHGLEWCKVFHPAQFAAERVSPKLPRLLSPPISLTARTIDAMLERKRKAPLYQAGNLRIQEASPADFSAAAQSFLEDYTVRPLWGPDEVQWIVAMASGNRRMGTLKLRLLSRASGEVCGGFAYLGLPNGTALVLNILARKRLHDIVLHELFLYMESEGHVAVRGRAEPGLLGSLSRHKHLFLRHKAHVCVSTRHADITDAIGNDSISIGGLAGEGWSRLMLDFF